jgi:hypothetical protein
VFYRGLMRHRSLLYLPAAVTLFVSIDGPPAARAADRPDRLAAEPVAVSPMSALARSVAVPESFLGLSQEWPWVSSMTLSRHAIDIIGLLQNDNGPLILRVGGTSHDAGYDRARTGDSPAARMQREGAAKTLDALATLRDALRMRFIITLTMANRDMTLLERQAEECRTRLGDAVMAFELGNEPNYYKELRSDLWPDDGRGLFYRDLVTVFGQSVQVAGDTPCAGPAWGWIGLKPEMMERYLDAADGRLSLLTVHYYHSAHHRTPPADRPNDTPETLLDDGHTRDIMATWVRSQVALARKHRVPLRITECNSISGGGNVGVSDVYAAALWSLDTALEMAAAGVAGVDFHQGSGKYAIYERFTQGKNAVSEFHESPPLYHSYRVQPPFYGLLFFQRAVTAGTRIAKVDHRGPSSLKVYQVIVKDQLRTVIVNKSPSDEVRLAVRLPAPRDTGAAALVRLLSPGNAITARSGITIAGVSHDVWGGHPVGQRVEESIWPVATDATAEGIFRILMAPASAAILTQATATP